MNGAQASAAAGPTPPMLSGVPVLGNAVEFYRDRAGLFERGLRDVGPIFGIRLFNQPAVVLVGPDHHKVFFEQTDKTLGMDKPYAFLAAVFGKVAFLASHEVYTRQRPLLHSPFKAEKMQANLRIMQLEAQRFIDSLGSHGEMEITSRVTQVVQDIAAHALLGREFRERAGPGFWEQYGIIGKALDPVLPPNLPLPKFIRRDAAKKKLRAMILPMIAERRAHPDRFDDFLAEFANGRLADGQAPDDDTIVSLILALVFAGHETTAGQAAWSVIQIASNADYRDRVQREVDQKLAENPPIDAAKLMELQHVRWAVSETTRMHPSADILIRTVEEEMEVGGFRIPRGWLAFVTAEVAQRLPEVFTDPHRYDPLRFSPERREDGAHRYGIIGFGGGLHKCAGMNFANAEMSILAALLFRKLDIELLDAETQAVHGMGAARPSPTRIRYRQRS